MDSAEAADRDFVSEDEVPEHLRISSSDLHIEELIGYGSSSVVYKANWLCCEVAVKDSLAIHDVGSFTKELEILMRLPHPHVVQLLGFRMTGEPRRLSIVMEHLEASLSRVISARMRTLRHLFDVCEAVDIVTKIALGMKFLHSRDIVHGGLSTGIILMNVHGEKDFDIKIAGFSFSDYVNCHSPTDLSFYLRSTSIRVTKAEDVFSFGMICYAVLTGCQLGFSPWKANFTPWNQDYLIQEVISGLRPELIAPDIDHDFVELILKCMDANPEDRPSFSVICDTLAMVQAAREQILQKQTLEKENSDALQWTTYEDSDDNTCLEIATILETLPNHLSIDPADVEWRRPIGEGSCNKVYEVNWLGCTFAAKRFMSLSAILKEEVEFLTKLQHPHIARLIGLSIDSNGGWIIIERMETDLQRLIHSRTSSPPFSDSEARELCFKIALGLNFLHSKNVVHRDIKPANVLVHDHHGCYDVKITDFGVSHRIGNTNIANYAGTGLWRAPEILKANRGEPLTEDQLKKTDVYSFGTTCYGIVTGNALHEHFSVQDVIAKRRPKLPAALDADLRELISKCWDDDPDVRPDFSTICHVLARKPCSSHVVPRSRAGAFVELLWRKWLPFSQCLPLG